MIAPGSPEWLQAISPSKVPVILGVSRFQSQFSLWHEMAGLIPYEPATGAKRDMYNAGHAFEAALAALWRFENPDWRLSRGEVQFDRDDMGFRTLATIDRRATIGNRTTSAATSRVVEFKALACSTPILTTHGWSTMGELVDGDEVYAPDGQATKVLSAHPILLGRQCYRVVFRDGQTVIADGDHLWQVSDCVAKRDRVLTTHELMRLGLRSRKQWRYQIPVTSPIETMHRELPIDPWLLGMWLGDGAAQTGRIACGESDLNYLLEQLDHLGAEYKVYGTKCPTVRVGGLTTALRSLGVLGNKHIPSEYLLASVDQRRALLAGIMDSDGTAGGHQATVAMIRKQLMTEVLQLVRSLGYRSTLRVHDAILDGECAGLVYAVRISANHTVNPFRMPRKRDAYERARGVPGPKKQDVGRNSIVDITEVESVPVRCITVAHESALYTVGEGFLTTHNTARDLTDWGDDFTDQAPADYLAQVQWQMHVTGYTQHPGHLMVMGPFFRWHTYQIPYDGELAEAIEQACRNWMRSITDGVAPDLDDSVTTYETVRQLHPDIEDRDVTVDQALAREFLAADRDLKALTTVHRGLKTRVLDAMGTARTAHTANGLKVADRRPGRHAISLYPASKTLTELEKTA